MQRCIIITGAAQASTVVDEIASNGGSATVAELDVTNSDSCGAMVERAMERFGRIDVLLNNAALRAPSVSGSGALSIFRPPLT
jgi:NAD(P)-dependent dehydrogenase (short-subunit alcohol dehydrogenase family)